MRAGDSFFVAPGTAHGFETFAGGGEAVPLDAVCPAQVDEPRPLLEAIWGRARVDPETAAASRGLRPPRPAHRGRSGRPTVSGN